METQSFAQGEPSWQDQSSPDIQKSADFYSGLFGWECPEGTEEFGGYRNCTLDGKVVAGLAPQMGGPGPSYWATYFNAESADDIAKAVAENGGQVIMEPMDVGPFGRMAVFSDPAGASFGVWQPAEHKGFQVRNEPGTVCWHELVTTDVAASSGFYPAVFGWTVASHGPAEGPGGYTEFKIGDKMIGGMMAKPPMMPAEVPPHWGLYFAVDDADAAAAKVTELGGKVLMGPMDIEPGRVVVVADSAGATFTLLKSSR